MQPDKILGAHFKKAEKELNNVAKKHGFTVRLVDAISGTWYFFPEVCDSDAVIGQTAMNNLEDIKDAKK